MSLQRWFRISLYVSLALAVGCLSHAEWGLLPEVTCLGGVVGLLLILAYLLEGRWVLSATWANVLGAVIAGGVGLWIVAQMPKKDSLLQTLPWPTALMPYLGALLMVLIPAKLFRPKYTGDVWGLLACGLFSVTLACALTDDAAFALLLLVYLVAAMWCLSLFHLAREGGPAAPARRLPGLGRAARWMIPLVAFALTAFLLAPRSGANWQLEGPLRARTPVGFGDEAAIDLNRLGALVPNPDVAFEVEARNADGTGKTDLSGETRWRGVTFRYYYHGRWHNTPMPRANANFGAIGVVSTPANLGGDPTTRRMNAELPDFGSAQYTLSYRLRGRLAQPVLAEPLAKHPSGDLPVISIRGNGTLAAWYRSYDGTPFPTEPLRIGRIRYIQVCVPSADPELSASFPLEQATIGPLSEPSPTLPNLKPFADAVLAQLIQRGWLAADVLADLGPNGRLNPTRFEEVARALTRWFVESGEFKYSLNLDRADTDLDPVEDFLRNTRRGHCNRFTTALAVLLKALAIPSQVVLGFRGHDDISDGKYLVRHSHAHSWVEVPIPRTDAEGRLAWHWRTFDPTPSESSEDLSASEALGRWWDGTQLNSQRLYRSLIVNYSPESRDAASEELWGTTLNGFHDLFGPLPGGPVVWFGGLVVLVAFGIAIVLMRRAGSRAGGAVPAFELYRRLLRTLAKRGWRPTPAQTPREFAGAVRADLSKRSDGSPLADIVDRLVELYYAARFGARVPTAEAMRTAHRDLSRLALGLAGRGD